MKTKLAPVLGLLMAISAGILAVADQMIAIASINPTLAHAWPVVLAAATSIDRLGKLFAKTPAAP